MNPPSGVARPSLAPLETVQAMWQNLAHRFFENRLPRISIEWSTRLTASAGLFVSQVGPRSVWVSHDFRQGAARIIKLSAPLLRNQPEEELWRILAHEMIHQWQFDIRKHRPSHGGEFREMMQRMNAEGLGVTVRHQLETSGKGRIRFSWKCLHCGMAYHRQRRTIIPSRHICSRCRGRLVEVELQRAGKPEEAFMNETLANKGGVPDKNDSAATMAQQALFPEFSGY